MKKFEQIRYFMLLSIITVGSVGAGTYSQKTYFAPRAFTANRAMEYTTWHEMTFKQLKPPSKSSINSHIALTGFYQDSQKSTDLGKYFGVGNGSNSFTVGASGAGVAPATTNVINSYLIHDQAAAGTSTLAGNITFKPNQETYGVRLDYFQDINDPIKKFFFKATMPVVTVKQTMGMTISGAAKTAAHASNGNTTFGIQDFFAGNVSLPSGAGITNAQGPLTKAKINGSHNKAGIADLNLALGYKLFQSTQNHIFFNAGVLLPTGAKGHGEYLFEPRCGNGGHTGFTMGLDGGIELWASKEKEATMRVLAALDYRYLFEATEYRTPQLQANFFPSMANVGGPSLNYYYLGGYAGTANTVKLFPAANVFTQGLRVKPGNQGEALVDFSFQGSGFVIDLGYNAFYKDAESVWIKNWNDNTFAIVARDYSTANALDIPVAGATFGTFQSVKKTNFDMNSVTNPSQFSHKVFGGLGYSFTTAKKYKSTLGIGASYEFASDNSTMEAIALWVKGGMSF